MDCFPERQQLKEAWRNFVATGLVDRNIVRGVIADSWKRSRDYGVCAEGFPKLTPLDDSQFAARCAENKELLDIAKPVIERLVRFVAGSGFMVALADAEGYLLYVSGDPEGVAFGMRSKFTERYNWSESSGGTNSVGLSLFTDSPVQIFAAEHYARHAHSATCSAAPIHDPQSQAIIGVLDVTGPCNAVHRHTLGMVVAARDAIEAQLRLHRDWKTAYLSSEQKRLIMETMSDGVLTINRNGIVTHTNRRALEMLGLTPDPAFWIGHRLEELASAVSSDSNLAALMQVVSDGTKAAELSLTLSLPKKGTWRLALTCRPIISEDSYQGTVVVLQEVMRLKRMLQNMVGGWAQAEFSDLLGEDPAFSEAVHIAEIVAASDCPVLILGETGTGKDLMAQSIHNASFRREHSYVALNCGAMSRELLNSELFGYEEGAFTGAKRGGHPGKFELASGGTLFLDEIGEMPLDMQASLLRVLEEKAIVRLGGIDTIPIDVRIIAATHRNLKDEVERGSFRRDLFYRLNMVTIELPPLRDRRIDIPVLANGLLDQVAQHLGKSLRSFDPAVLSLFLAHDWPGNIRELQNVIERAALMCDGEVILEKHLPREYRNEQPRQAGTMEDIKYLDEVEKVAIINSIRLHGGNVSEAAKQLGVARSTLYRKIKSYGLYKQN